MRGLKQGGARAPAPLQQGEQLLGPRGVKAGGQFVQKEERRCRAVHLGKGPRQKHPLPFPAGKRLHPAVGKNFRIHGGKGPRRRRMIPAAVEARP